MLLHQKTQPTSKINPLLYKSQNSHDFFDISHHLEQELNHQTNHILAIAPHHHYLDFQFEQKITSKIESL